MKISCEVVKDLLPLYCDNVCSGESKALVEEHLEECEACREEYQRLREAETAQAQAGEEQRKAEALKKVKKKLRAKRIVAAVLSVVLFAVACTGAGMWMNVATVDVDGEGLIERVKYDPTPPEWIKNPDILEESELTQEELDHWQEDLDHWGGRLKIYPSKDRRETDTFGLTFGLFPVKMDGETKMALICSIRRTVWDYLTCRPPENETSHPTEVDVGGPPWRFRLDPDDPMSWMSSCVAEGYFTKEELETMARDECMVKALYYVPYSKFREYLGNTPEESAKILKEGGILLWEKED